MVKLLENYGADIHSKNNQGLSVLHIAAQGDQPVSMVRLSEKVISQFSRHIFNLRDLK